MSNPPVLLLDGGLGTSLEDAYAVVFGPDTPLWSSHLLLDGRHHILRACQADFGQVPVDILSTATYQLSIEGFARSRCPSHPAGVACQHIAPFLEMALTTAEAAVASGAAIALSLGPYGASMTPSQEYSGNYDAQHCSVAQLLDWHADRLRLFDSIEDIASRVGFVAFETVPRLDEIIAIRRLFAYQQSAVPTSGHPSPLVVASSIPFWISCVFPGQDDALPDSSTVSQVVNACFDLGHSSVVPWGIGINCTKVGRVPQLVKQFEVALYDMVAAGRLSEWPSLILYPDGTNGEVYDTTAQIWKLPEGQPASTSPWGQQLSDVVTATRKQGRWRSIVVGGCCKASHRHIQDLKAIGIRSGWYEGQACG